MKTIGYTWGIGGVLLLLLFAIYRLTPIALELEIASLAWPEQAALAFSVLYMIYAEGYKGFHLAFAPRVVLRARWLRDNPSPRHVMLAPIFCMGYIHATPRRRLMTIGLTTMIICFVLIVRLLPQPWRGIVDAGVVAGLLFGIASIFWFVVVLERNPASTSVSAEMPVEERAGK